MLKDLIVLNGDMPLKFNEYTYEYTINVAEDVEELKLEYKLEDECFAKLSNNKLTYGENILSLDVYNIDNKITYTLYVYRENVNEANKIHDYMASIEINNKEEVNINNIQLLSIGIFIVLLFFFCLIFRKKKN